ncbi:ALF repeat-containing protein [Streptomyces sp. rh207]|uniref:ALF repeat-containing protein n=1 Tax=Streptomyces sp. rh207 TaxID=2034269 RepID=UPI001C54E62F|nr:ALF repeat-containing protein [Streptomyces sp. rh207]
MDLAGKAAKAAREARDAANSAATHARNAAAAADEAADHAGDAAKAAAESTKHAGEAKKAADSATAAVTKASATYTLARELEAEELADRKHIAIEEAKAAKIADNERYAAGQRASADAKAADAEALRLASLVNTPGTDQAQAAKAARKVGLHVMKTRGPWSVTTAEMALAGADDQVIEYIRKGWQKAAEQDEYARTNNLVWESEYAAVRTAAEAALLQGPEQIEAFLETGQHEAAKSDYRIEVVKLMNGAGPGVTKAGQAALDSGSTDKLREFITTGFHNNRRSDERVRAMQLFSTGTPELKTAAEVALAGSPEILHEFIEVGQYRAKRKDQLTATHVSRVQGLIAGSARIAAKAQQDAALAAKVAAEARKAAADAAEYARQAQASADKATDYAKQADAHADNAEKSAADAAASARTARSAEADAHNAARQANSSAARAENAATAAQNSASDAWASADAARVSATEAGKDSAAAQKAMDEALDIAFWKMQEEIRQLLSDEVAKQEAWDLLAEDQAFEDHMRKLEEIDWGKALSEGGHLGLDILGLIPGLGEPADLVNCLWYFGEGKKMDAGLSCAAIVPVAGWLATAGKGGKWVTKADGFFKKLFSKNPAFTVCALPKSLSGTSARAGLRACPVEFENFGNEVFGSPAGLIYQRMTNGKHRIDHVMDHTRPGPPGKPRHGIFKQKDERKLLRFVDDAWKKRDKKTSIVAPNGDTAWPVEYGGVIGENGETFVCVVTRHSKKKFRVITAYPSPDATCPRN